MVVSWVTYHNVVIAFSFIGFVLVNIPLCWHLEAWNMGCVLYIFWAGSQCLIQFVNAVIWKNNVINWAPVWCDITSRWLIASSVGIPTASLLISKRIYHIANITTVQSSRADRRRMVLIDTSIGLGIPIVQVALYWFIQGHRFDIIEGFGCIFAIPNTILSSFLFYATPIYIGLVSAVYAALTIRAFYKRHKQIRELMSANSSLKFNRYFRLMVLAGIEICLTIPLGIWTLVSNATQVPIYQWEGLANLHYGFSAVDQIPAIIEQSDPSILSQVAFNQWSVISCALLFFALFGVTGEAQKHYRVACESVMRRLGLNTVSFGRLAFWTRLRRRNKPPPADAIIPTFIQRPKPEFPPPISISLSLDDVGPDGNVKATYPPSSHSGDSSTYVSHLDVKVTEKPLPPLPPSASLDVTPVVIARPLPDVPWSVSRDSIEIV
ncbi:hypothetical fungal pheromone GPCR, STE3-type [Postia placenta Mad-698-R]|uniref:Mating-type-like pheromone receptor n=1 Tax=Postia placenta MAD-698-R-SB12 TaxID=670580 RepID=A0A1X6MTJ2_9APHY|nr:hypothetical protein POSPLADRAFT_1171933 [Postia placenta MAD-698-R-SB12]EED83216.1 hypothetical fungal pheromone GPCR, STE3-type [Postia placenta Mad-698-R]OSX59704.1 hypothetical protein POSPLADRAFT_1171933 [Postia placenta MAD-698-R-SB12]